MKNKWLRNLLLGVFTVLLLAGAGAWLLARQIDRDAVTARAIAEVKRATGRDFAIGGTVHLQFFPTLALVANDVRLGNTAWGSRPDMLRARRLALNVALRPLLSRRVEVGRIELSGADLLLETSPQGEANWRFARADTAAPLPDADNESARKVHVSVAQLLAQDSTLSLRNGHSGNTRTLAIQSLRLGDDAADAVGTAPKAGPGTSPTSPAAPAADPATTALDPFALEATYRGQAVHVAGRTGPLRSIATASALPIDLQLSVAGASATLAGDLGLREQAGQARLQLEAQVEQSAALAQVLGVALPATLPLPASLKATLDWDRERLRAEPMEWRAAGQTLGGRLEWNPRATPPALHAALRADGLDLARLVPAASGGGSAEPDGRLFSDAPLPRLAPSPIALSGELNVERLVLPGGIELGAVRARASMAGDRLELSSLTFGLARGTVNLSGSLRVTAGQAPAVSARIKARNLAMDSLLALTRRKAVLSGGRTEIDADLRGEGSSPHRLAASLDGEVRLRMGAATTAGQASAPQDLLAAFARALTPNHAPSETIRIQCAAARLPLRNGVIEVDRSMAVETDKLSLVMAGRIDLGNETLELAIRPTVRKGLGLKPGNFADLVKIGGTLSHPAVQVDVLGTAREAVSLSAAVASSGATLLAGRLLQHNANPQPCQAALSTAAPANSSPGKARSSSSHGPTPLRDLFGR